jgi:hypothetical protein
LLCRFDLKIDFMLEEKNWNFYEVEINLEEKEILFKYEFKFVENLMNIK